MEEYDPNEQVDDTLLSKPDIPEWLDGEERGAFSVLLDWVNFSEKQSNNRLVGKVFWDDEDEDIKCYLEDLRSDKTIHIKYIPRSQKFAVQLIDHTDNTQPKTLKRKISTMKNIKMTLKEFKDRLSQDKNSVVVETTTLGKLRENLITEEKQAKAPPTFKEMDDIREKIRKGLMALEAAIRVHAPTSPLIKDANDIYLKFMDLPSFETYFKKHRQELSEKAKAKEDRIKRMAQEVAEAGNKTVVEADETMAVKIGTDAKDQTIEKATKTAQKLKTDVVFESRNSLMNSLLTESEKKKPLNEEDSNTNDNVIVLKELPRGGVRIYYPTLFLSDVWINLDKALNRVNILMNQRQEEFPIYVVDKVGQRKKVERNYGREILDEYDDEGFESGAYNKNEEMQGLYGKGIRPFNKINWIEVYETIQHNNTLFESDPKKTTRMLNTGDFMDELLLSDAEIKHLENMQLIWLHLSAFPVFYEGEIPTYQQFRELAEEFWDHFEVDKPAPREPRGSDLEPAD